MAWWKALLVNVVAVPTAATITIVVLQVWFNRRQEVGWPLALATVSAYRQGPGFKNLSATYLVGRYASPDHGWLEFTVKWDASELVSGAWVPPANVPPLGSTIRVHVDPRNPSHVALAEGPRVVTAVQTLSLMLSWMSWQSPSAWPCGSSE